jgi:glycosyltransferase involved in cell wall biosynthesis
VILVDDASTDRSIEIAEQFLKTSGKHYQIIRNQEQEGKKNAIRKAMASCSGELILLRDADTYTRHNAWLLSIVGYYEATGKSFIIAPIEIETRASVLNGLQVLENDALAIITAGYAFQQKPFLCNGANLAFTKEVFHLTGEFTSHLGVASGDDVLFLEDVKRLDPKRIGYLKQRVASVNTYPMTSLSELFSQKVRWAAKMKVNPNKFNTFLGILVFLLHFSSIFLIISFPFHPKLRVIGLIFILLRFFIDFLLLFLASRYFKKRLDWAGLVPIWLFYSVIAVIIGIGSLFYKPKWK